MKPITYIDRVSGKIVQEKVYGGGALQLLYGPTFLSRFIGTPLTWLVSRFSLFSTVYGLFQKTRYSRKKIVPFVKAFDVDVTEFQEPVESFSSFNDFFIRKLKPEVRPMAPGANVAVIPADGRYLFYQNLAEGDGWIVKGERFSLEELVGDKTLASHYTQGTLVLARLCPSDYHRFHFPCDCVPGESRLINGTLYSVNPLALKQNIGILAQNKRRVCVLETQIFGKILYIEVGATNVGTIHETYIPFKPFHKGDEKGYFSFGGSALVLLFPPGALQLDPDLTAHPHTEIRCLLGQSLGKGIT